MNTDEKARLRRELRSRLDGISVDQRAAFSRDLCARLQRQAIWQAADSVLFFSPRPDEPDTSPLLEEALVLGKCVCLPRYSEEHAAYKAVRVSDPRRDLQTGRFNILEPVLSYPVVETNRLDLLLVPGLGFSFTGVRLGRGAGFYDRLLAGASGWKCGVTFDCQVMAALPEDSHDVRVDCLLTPSLWRPVPAPREP